MVKVKKYSFYLLLAPGFLFLLVFAILPLVMLISGSFASEGSFTLSRYIEFFKDDYYITILLRTLKLALISTVISAVLGFPTAYYISKTNVNKRGLYIALSVFPMLTSPVVRSFSWMVILGKYGIVNNLLIKIGLIREPLSLLYNEFSIVVGFVYLFMPLMILSLVGVLENIDKDLIMAAESLGATRFKAFMKVIFPLSVPGLIVGSVLVFTGSLTAYTTPQLLGGTKSRVLATVIYQNAMTLFDWDTAAVVATIMIIVTILVSGIINSFARKLNSRG
ncbi:putative spermidine/putrescine transport system permease protein [Proteiniborus ethanoligenes]|uniref:Putative spermidine/putrescine transport system permease protein n=1 Tax=Proteiniborus ethanoligenes TaxID=415015 RepID=A0A1H3LXV7_9FIRM|nr:putative spermidine/putrescine transport system permease protein [Proteiniborus ethanoligenes]